MSREGSVGSILGEAGSSGAKGIKMRIMSYRRIQLSLFNFKIQVVILRLGKKMSESGFPTNKSYFSEKGWYFFFL